MSRLNELLKRAELLEKGAKFVEGTIDFENPEHVIAMREAMAKDAASAPVMPTQVIQEVTSSKAKWGSLLPALLGGVAAPFTAQALPDHILATMGFWQYLVWILAQAGLFYGATFLNVYLSPPNTPK